MAKIEVLLKLKDVEDKVRENREKAIEEKEKVISEARKRAVKILEDKEAEAAALSKRLLKEAHQRINTARERIAQESAGKMQELEAKTRANMNAASDYLVSQVDKLANS